MVDRPKNPEEEGCSNRKTMLRLFVQMPSDETAMECELEEALPQVAKTVTPIDIHGITGDVFKMLSITGDHDCHAAPIPTIQSFIDSIENGIYPDKRVLRWISTSFKDWLNHHAEKPLEKCFGLQKGRGQDPALKDYVLESVKDQLVHKIMQLHCALGVSVKDCKSILACWMENSEWYKGPSVGVKALQEDALTTAWKKAKWARDPDRIREVTLAFDSDNAKRELINRYPRYCWEHIEKLKRYL